MRSIRRPGSLRGRACAPLAARCFAAAVLITAAAGPAAAQPSYHLEVGDVVELLVAGVPELQRQAAVQIDGTVSLPLIGAIQAAGVAVTDLEANVRLALATKVLRSRAPDGRRDGIMIDPAAVNVTVAAYRPIYVDGDVSRPGEQPYRPLITVRQVITLCGGYDLMRSRIGNPLLEALDYRSEYESLWLEFAREQARVWRIKTELGREAGADANALAELPLAPSTVREVMDAERDYLQLRESDFSREKSFLERDLGRATQEADVLQEQKRKEEQGMQLDLEEHNAIAALFGKGTATSARLTEARRAALQSATRALHAQAQLLQIKRQQDDLVRKKQQLDDQRRMGLARDLQEAVVRIGQVRVKLRAVGEKLQYASLGRSQLIGDRTRKLQIRITRKNAKGAQHFSADEDTVLEPGDVVDVALREDTALTAAR